MNRVHTYLGSFQLMQILVQDEPCNPLPVYQVLFAGTALLKERERWKTMKREGSLSSLEWHPSSVCSQTHLHHRP